MSIRVAVVDDQALVRGGFAMVLGHQDDIEVVAEAGTGLEAIEVVRIARRLAVDTAVSSRLERLTDREREVLAAVARVRATPRSATSSSSEPPPSSHTCRTS